MFFYQSRSRLLAEESMMVLGVHDGHDARAILAKNDTVLAALEEGGKISLELLFKR